MDPAPGALSPVSADGLTSLRIAAGVSALLAAAKLAAGLVSGSLVLLASAGDSFSDALMSAVNAWGYARARAPADAEHPWGHGKLEGALAAAQGTLLLGIVASVAVGSGMALVQGRERPDVPLAVGALVLSGVAAALLSRLLGKASQAGSVVVAADAAHYRTDLLASSAAVAGLVGVELTGRAWLDPAASLLLVGLMAREGARVVRKGLGELLDEALPPAEMALVQATLERHRPRVIGFHGLRTRRSGPLRFVEVHAAFDPELPLRAVHQVVVEIVRDIAAVLPESRVLVHPDAHGLEDPVDERLPPPAG